MLYVKFHIIFYWMRANIVKVQSHLNAIWVRRPLFNKCILKKRPLSHPDLDLCTFTLTKSPNPHMNIHGMQSQLLVSTGSILLYPKVWWSIPFQWVREAWLHQKDRGILGIIDVRVWFPLVIFSSSLTHPLLLFISFSGHLFSLVHLLLKSWLIT